LEALEGARVEGIPSGSVLKDEFISHFDTVLVQDLEEFKESVTCFLEVGRLRELERRDLREKKKGTQMKASSRGSSATSIPTRQVNSRGRKVGTTTQRIQLTLNPITLTLIGGDSPSVRIEPRVMLLPGGRTPLEYIFWLKNMDRIKVARAKEMPRA